MWHGGVSRDGYNSFIGFDPERKLGVVVVSNAREPVADIGFHLLDERMPLDPNGKPRAIAIDAARLGEYPGRYEARPDYVVKILRRGDRLFGHANAKPRELIAVAEDRFVIKGLPIGITFVRDDAGRIASLILGGGGQIVEGQRLP